MQEGNNQYVRSCENCDFYYQSEEDDEELCQNPQVLEYDMIFDENRVYCLRWQPYKEEKDA
jgi:hypothetical protein